MNEVERFVRHLIGEPPEWLQDKKEIARKHRFIKKKISSR
jgi:hypothetical protein